MAAIAGESMELEVMRKEDGSWHPCRVSLSYNDATFIIAEFESCNEEDIISNREDALARLRFRSTPLQDGECSHIKEGECVLAMHKDQTRSLFFDAVIEKTNRVKHSNRVHCRCTFEVKWLSPKLNGETMTLPSKSVMKLSDKDIDSHPKFAAFLNALTCRNGLEVPSFLDLFEETTSATDLQGLLEKQIEEISKLADVSEGSKDVLLEVKRANLNGRRQSKVVVTSQISMINCHDDFRRSTRSQCKRRLEVELEKHLEDVPLLSPLAARAALASLVHELPHEPELSICQIEKRHVNVAPEDPPKDINEHSLDVEGLLFKSDSKSGNDVSVVLSSTLNSDNDAPVEERNLSRLPISTGRITMNKYVSEESPDSSSQEKPGASRESSKQLGSSTVVKRLKTSVTDGKLNGRMAARLTRSAVQSKILNSAVEMEQGFSNEKFKSLVSTRSLRSAERTDANIKQELGSSNLIQNMEELVTPENSECHKKKSFPSSVGAETNLTLERRKRTRASSVTAPTKEDQGEFLQDGESDPAANKKVSSSKKPALRFSPRLRFLPRTRSQKKSSAAQ